MRKHVDRYIYGRVSRREITKGTGRREHCVLRSFAASYGNRAPRNVSKADVERRLTTRAHLAPGTRRHEVSVMRNFCRWLQLENVIARDPMLRIKTPKVPRRVPRALNPDHDTAIQAVLPDTRAWAIYALMRWCGLRRIEIHRLEVGDWDRTLATLRVVGKGGHEREVPVTDRATRRLLTYLDEANWSAGPLIRRKDGTGPLAPHSLGMLMNEWMRTAGVKTRAWDGRGCHSHRHTLASNVADVEPDLRVVQYMLGHTSLATTEIYLRHATTDRVRAAMESAA